jgi:hypothetical protein
MGKVHLVMSNELGTSHCTEDEYNSQLMKDLYLEAK